LLALGGQVVGKQLRVGQGVQALLRSQVPTTGRSDRGGSCRHLDTSAVIDGTPFFAERGPGARRGGIDAHRAPRPVLSLPVCILRHALQAGEIALEVLRAAAAGVVRALPRRHEVQHCAERYERDETDDRLLHWSLRGDWTATAGRALTLSAAS